VNMELSFLKCHGMGNDYVLVDIEMLSASINEAQMVKLSTLLCSRKGVVGADGAIFVSPDREADAFVRVFNTSGSESELCINGVRCAGRYIIEKCGKPSVLLRTAAGIVPLSRASQPFPGISTMTMHIHGIERLIDPHFYIWPHKELWDTPIVALSPDLHFFAVTINIPHILSTVDTIDLRELVSIGEMANRQSSIFPQGVNVSFIAPIDDSTLYVRTYERGGAGLTHSCASAMLAASFLICELSNAKFNKPIQVYSSGGMATVICSSTIDGVKGSAEIKSTSTFVYTAKIEYDPVKGAMGSHFQGDFNDAEVMQYGRYLSSLGIKDIEARVLSLASPDRY
jgi:diaminopimelate epimerase